MQAPRILISGRPVKQGFAATIAGVDVYLSAAPFRLMTMLAFARKGVIKSTDGWLHTVDLSRQPGNVSRYLYRMRQQVWDQSELRQWKVFENDRLGSYRIDTLPERIHIDFDTLKDFPDYAIAAIARCWAHHASENLT